MIHKLPESLSSRIAAGEVVERPVSVVKELLENSLDAGARRIDIKLIQGGKVSLFVEDDGRGIAFDELPLAVERYATSKLSSLEDLYAISTLGYRGEALASIALVSRMEIRSAPEGALEGGMLRVEEGLICLHEKISCPKGTSIQVKDLFCSIPARKKFLKSPAGETRRIARVVREYAIAYPEVTFMLFSEGKPLFSSFGDGDRSGLLGHVWGDPRVKEWSDHAEGYGVRAYRLQKERSEGIKILSFVNGRRCEDALFPAAVKAGSPRPGGQWLFLLEVPPEDVDVNVHPAKIEVRFRQSRRVFQVLHRAVQRLGGDAAPLEEPSSSMSGEGAPSPRIKQERAPFPWEEARERTPFPRKYTLSPSGHREKKSSPLSGFSPERVASPCRAAGGGPSGMPPSVRGDSAPELSEAFREGPPDTDAAEPRYLGQLRSGYLLFDLEGDLVVMDPHAAHERVEYDEVVAICSSKGGSQKLLAPPTLSPSLGERSMERRDNLEENGFLLGERSDGSIELCQVPHCFERAGISPLEGLRMTLDVLEKTEQPEGEHLWKAWAFLACKRAVKLTDSLSEKEALLLWKRLFTSPHPGSCPHGRPTILRYAASFLEKEFHRK